jgi:hypothetical protein
MELKPLSSLHSIIVLLNSLRIFGPVGFRSGNT